MRTRRTSITIETHQVWVARMSPAVARAWCCACNRTAGLVALPYAALLSGRTQAEVNEQVEHGELHSQKGPDGVKFVCLNSLLQAELWRNAR